MERNLGFRAIPVFFAATAVLLSHSATVHGGSLQSVSVRNPSVALPSGGDGNSVAPVLSADGRFVLFSSAANDLVPSDNNQLGLDMFLRDRSNNTTTLASCNWVGLGGGNGDSLSGVMSAHGRYVVFQSDASDLLPGDTNNASDIFMRDTRLGVTDLISVAADGGWGNNRSTDPVITPDGNHVVFVSLASNLVPGDTNGAPDMFMRDLEAQTTTLITVGASAGSQSGTPAVTADGRYVAFWSTSTNLAPGATRTQGDIYLRDLVAGKTTWVSSNTPAFVLTNSPATHPVISADGRFVAFKCGGAGGVGSEAIFRYDASSNALTLVAGNGFPQYAWDDDLYGPEMTPDGRFIAYAVVTTNNNTAYASVHLWDAQNVTDTLVSQDVNGGFPTNTMSRGPVLSPDGRYVAFLSNAGNLVTNTVSSGYHLYLRDMIQGTTKLIDADINGNGSVDVNGSVPSLSSNGQFVAFSRSDSNLVAGDNNRSLDVFVRDTVAGTNELISCHNQSIQFQTGNGITSVSQTAVSANGRWIVFSSGSFDLVPNDFNTDEDVFVWDTQGQSNTLVSVGLDGNAAMGGYSAWPVISGDGRFIAFQSAATNLVPNDSNGASDIFLRDMQAGSTMLVSISTNGGASGNGDSTSPDISQDGRYVAFLSGANNLDGGAAGTFWRDTQSGITVRLPGSIVGLAPSMSANGQYVAYSASSSQLRVWDVFNSTNIALFNGNSFSMALSPTGDRLLVIANGITYIMDLLSNRTLFSANTGNQWLTPAQWSGDGRLVVFTSLAGLVPSDANGTNDVYAYDCQSGSIRLVSANVAGTGSGDGASDSPILSSNGRFVLYRTLATDIVPTPANLPSIIMYDRATGSNALVNVEQAASSWVHWIAKPAASSDGSTVAFQSWDPGLVSGDLNAAGDAFAAEIQPWAQTDTDGDGIPDWWMTKYFGHPTGQAGDLSRAQDDADGDGMSNLQEYLAGTDPTNPASAFRLQIAPGPSIANATLTWPASPAHGYQIQFKANVTDPLWLNAPGFLSLVGNQGYYTVTTSQTNGFYRLLLVP